MDFLHNNLQKRKHEHNTALIVDLATNLMSMIARGKGGRYSFATNNANVIKEHYNEAQRYRLQAPYDYGARLASATFKDMLQKYNNVNGIARNHIVSGLNNSRKSILLKPITLEAGLVKPQKPKLISLSGFEKK